MTLRYSGGPQRCFPFAALVGQSQLKLALQLVAVLPTIGGLLIRGDKGTAKSTAARSLVELLPPLDVPEKCSSRAESVETDRYAKFVEDNVGRTEASRWPNFVNLPLGATEDCVIGTIDFEHAVRNGTRRFRPGLLARAHRGVLYVDEVNLLDDHIVDCLLDAVESGTNRVEREGISLSHPARFSLIGSMNPEEGELRPQLLDRFALVVEVKAETDLGVRVELLRRRESFDQEPSKFTLAYQSATETFASKIRAAKERVERCTVPTQVVGFIAELCLQNGVAGHRADLAIQRAAMAYAALAGRCEVRSDDVLAVSAMALCHRARKASRPESRSRQSEDDASSKNTNDNSEPRASSRERGNEGGDGGCENDDEKTQQSVGNAPSTSPEGSDVSRQTSKNDSLPRDDGNSEDNTGTGASARGLKEENYDVGKTYTVKALLPAKDRKARIGSGRRTQSRSANKQGRYVRSSMRREFDDLALDATLRAAAPYQIHRRAVSSRPVMIHIEEQDIRTKVRERRVGATLLFVVDGSGSMGAERRMTETKTAIMSLLMDAYQKRDKVGLVVFRQRKAEVLLDFTNSVERAARLLSELPVGGRTPLSAGLEETGVMLRRLLRKEPLTRPVVIILTDGKGNVSISDRKPRQEALLLGQRLVGCYPQSRFVVVDTEGPSAIRLGLAQTLATSMAADYYRTDELKAEELINLIREQVV